MRWSPFTSYEYYRRNVDNPLSYHEWLNLQWEKYFEYRNMPRPTEGQERFDLENSTRADFHHWLKGPSVYRAEKGEERFLRRLDRLSETLNARRSQ